jgi:hypothetical protein
MSTEVGCARAASDAEAERLLSWRLTCACTNLSPVAPTFRPAQVGANIATAPALKEEGNARFKEGDYPKAIAAYHQVRARKIRAQALAPGARLFAPAPR